MSIFGRRREGEPYEVGYGKPPKQHQFKPGHSGNSGGRRPSLEKLLERFSSDELPKSRSLKAVERAAISQAISLKRIADALTGAGPSILTAPINSYGEGIGDAIQGQIIRGQRGVDQYEGRKG